MCQPKARFDIPAILQFLKTLTVEPFFLLALLSYYLKSSVSGQLTQDKICMNDLHLSQAVCRDVTSVDLDGHAADKDYILKVSARYGLYGQLIAFIPGLIYALFLGSWMDKFPIARKMVMLGTCFGVMLDLIIDMVISILFDIPTPYVLISSLPSSLFGGIFSLFTAVYCHVIKTTAPENMVLRYASVEVIMSTSQPLGTFLPGIMLTMTPWFFPDKIRNFVGVYTIPILLIPPAIVLAYFFVNVKNDKAQRGEVSEINQEMDDLVTVSRNELEDVPWYLTFKYIFDVDNVKKMYSAFVKPRPNNAHKLLWLVTFGRSVSIFAMIGEMVVQYQFCQKHFNWTFENHSNVVALFAVLKIFVPIALLPFLVKILKLSLPVLGMLGCVIWIASLMLRGLVITEYGFYVSMLLHLPSSIAGTAVSTYLTTLVDPEEIGSVMAFTGVVVAVAPIAATTLFTSIFEATINTFPGLIFLINAVFVGVFLCVFVYLYIVDRRKARLNKD